MKLCSKCKTAPRKSENDAYCTECRRTYSREKSAERRASGEYEKWKKENPNYHTGYSRCYYHDMTEEQRARHRQQKANYERTPAGLERNRKNSALQRAKRKEATK